MIEVMRRARLLRLAVAAALLLAAASAGAADAGSKGSAPTGVVNLNSASAAELERLPGIGRSRAEAIVELRDQRGGFKSIDEIGDVKGIGDAMLSKLRPYLSLEGKTTLSGG